MRELLSATFESLRNSGDGEAARLEQILRTAVEDAPESEQDAVCNAMVNNLIEWLLFIKRRGGVIPLASIGERMRDLALRFRVAEKTAGAHGFRVYEQIFAEQATAHYALAVEFEALVNVCRCTERGWGGGHVHAPDCPLDPVRV